ncbi:uncharacterized protein Dvar_21730 [Desulfosarcina variabilis str. Montpellier]
MKDDGTWKAILDKWYGHYINSLGITMWYVASCQALQAIATRFE